MGSKRKFSDDIDRALQPEVRSTQAIPQGRKFSDDIPGSGFLGNVPVDSVLTEERIGRQTDPASFSSMAQTGLVDDPTTKMKIFAKQRFPNMPIEDAMKRYGIHKGEIVYLEDDGNLYYEVPPGVSRFKRFVAQEGVARLPQHALEAAGTLGGIKGVMAGSAAGELIRRGIGKLLYDDPLTVPSVAKSTGIEMGTSLLGEGAGRGAIRLIDRSRGKVGGRIFRAAGRDAKRMSADDIQRMQGLSDHFNVNLSTPELAGTPELVDTFNRFVDYPETAVRAFETKKKRQKEVSDAVKNFLNTLSPATTTPGSSGRRAAEASQAAIKSENAVRAGVAKPFYDEALERARPRGTDPTHVVNIEQTISLIDEKLRTAKGETRDHLIKAKDLLMKPDIEEGTEIFDTTMEGLHDARQELFDLADKAPQRGLGSTIKRNYNEIRASLTRQMEELDLPESQRSHFAKMYKKGREEFSEYSIIPEALKGTKIGRLSKLEGDAAEKAAQLVFNTRQSSPEIVQITKHYITKHGGKEAWNALLRTHIDDAFSEASKRFNTGGAFSRRLFEDPKQWAILEAAMEPAQVQYFRNLNEVLNRTGLLFRKESQTQPRLLTERKDRMRGGPGEKIIEYVDQVELTKPGTYFGSKVWGPRIREVLFEKRNIKTLDAMLNQKGADQLRRILKLGEGKRKLIRAFGIYATQLAQGAASGEVQRAILKDVPVKTSQLIQTLPPANENKGMTLRNKETGRMVRSDGISWKPVKPTLRAR